MENQNLQAKPNFDLKATKVIETPKGKKVFMQGVLLRKVSKFLIQMDEDGIVPVPVFYEVMSGKILKDSIPKEIRKDYEDDCI